MLFVHTPAGIVLGIGEVFSQKEVLKVRAQKIHELCLELGIDDPSPKTVPLWGDAANPQDIMELNLAFRSGWDVEEEDGRTYHVTSKLRVIAVASEGKIRKAAVERINNAFEENRLRFVKSLGAGQAWNLGMNAAEEGTPQKGSRLFWEMDNWSVAVPKEGEAQDQNPDDDTADGADCIAAARYALMSHWKPVKLPDDEKIVDHDRAWSFDVKKKTFVEPKHVADALLSPSSNRRRPAVRSPRPRISR
jgi:hypothetical protein